MLRKLFRLSPADIARTYQLRQDVRRVWRPLAFWKRLDSNQARSAEEFDDFTVASPTFDMPTSLRKQWHQSQACIQEQLKRYLSVVESADKTIPSAQQIYYERTDQEYLPSTNIEREAEIYKQRIQRVKGNSEPDFTEEAFAKVMQDLDYDEVEQWKARHNTRSASPSRFINQRGNSNNDEDDIQSQHGLDLLRQIENERLSLMRGLIKEKLGFCPYIAPSTIKLKDCDAGQGLFIDGECPPGTVISIYPGMVYTSKVSKHVPLIHTDGSRNLYLRRYGLENILLNGELQLETFFNTLYNHELDPIDAKALALAAAYYNSEAGNDHNQSQMQIQKPGLLQRIRDWLEGEERFYDLYAHLLGMRFVHPFALGHKANHPPLAGMPNCDASTFVVPLTFPPHLLPYVPNKCFIKPSAKRPGPPPRGHLDVGMIRTVVFVANRTLKDEEVFVNYSLDPDGSMWKSACDPNERYPPRWYYSIDEDEDRRRWIRE